MSSSRSLPQSSSRYSPGSGFGWKLWKFDPSTAVPKLEFSEAVAGVAGLVSSAVAAATAGVLGIEIQKGRAAGGTATLMAAVKASTFLKIGVLTYLIVGLVNLLVWLGNSSVAPEMIGAFALGALGWMGGAFSAVFNSSWSYPVSVDTSG